LTRRGDGEGGDNNQFLLGLKEKKKVDECVWGRQAWKCWAQGRTQDSSSEKDKQEIKREPSGEGEKRLASGFKRGVKKFSPPKGGRFKRRRNNKKKE